MKSLLRMLLLLAAVLVVVDALKVGWMEYTIAGTSVVGGAMVIAAGFVNSWYVKNVEVDRKKCKFDDLKSLTFFSQTANCVQTRYVNHSWDMQSLPIQCMIDTRFPNGRELKNSKLIQNLKFSSISFVFSFQCHNLALLGMVCLVRRTLLA